MNALECLKIVSLIMAEYCTDVFAFISQYALLSCQVIKLCSEPIHIF
jgi:hypothetical protein